MKIMSWIKGLISSIGGSGDGSEDVDPKKNQPEEAARPTEAVAPEHQDQVLTVESPAALNPHSELVEVASSFVGVTEEGGNNRGKVIEMFQRSVGPIAKFQPWCASFVWHCLKMVMDQRPGTICRLKLTAHVMTIWNTAPVEAKKKFGAPGYLMVWRKYGDDGKPLSEGHIGIVEEKMYGTMYLCIEGNTGPDKLVPVIS